MDKTKIKQILATTFHLITNDLINHSYMHIIFENVSVLQLVTEHYLKQFMTLSDQHYMHMYCQ